MPRMLFLTSKQFSVKTRVLSVHRCVPMVTGSFCTNIVYPHRKLLLDRSKIELSRFSALARNSLLSMCKLQTKH